jgi:hypothetical protein
MVQSETRRNDSWKYARTVCGLKLPKGLGGGGKGRLRSTMPDLRERRLRYPYVPGLPELTAPSARTNLPGIAEYLA